MKNTAFRLLAALLAVLVGIDTAAACRWLRACSRCEPVCMPVCEPICEPAYPPACSSWAVVESSCDSCDSCSETVVETHSPAAAPTVTSSGVPTPAAPPEPVRVYEPAPAAQAFGQSGFRSDTPSPSKEPMPSPSDWDAGLEATPPTPTTVESAPVAPVEVMQDKPEVMEERTDDLFAAPAAAEAAPSDDLFGAPAEESVAEIEEPADNLFGTPAEESADDDLFDEQPAEKPAADDLFGQEPAEEPTDDDLFGEEPSEEPAGDDLFGEEPAEDSGEGDLFGEPAPPAPTEAEPADDLFGTEPADEEDSAADDLFGEEPADEPAGNDEDDLFGTPAEDEADDADDLFGTPEDEDDEDLFGLGATLREAGGLYSAKDRTWIDNTGRYSTVGRLIAFDGAAVRLVKHDGAVATVPLSRLSQADLEFVSRQSIAQSRIREWSIANGKSPLEGLRTAQR